jgi:hypothetical protein
MNSTQAESSSAAAQRNLRRRLRRLLTCGAAAVLLAAAYVHFFLYLPMGSGPALDGAAFEQPWIASYEQRLDAMFTTVEERFPAGCAIFVADIPALIAK